MKTISKTLALAACLGLSFAGFSQANLGLNAAGSAALKTTASTASLLKATNATVSATGSIVSSTVKNVSTTVSSTQKTSASMVSAAGSDVKSNANGQANTSLSTSIDKTPAVTVKSNTGAKVSGNSTAVTEDAATSNTSIH